jgi:hypothetical protein
MFPSRHSPSPHLDEVTCESSRDMGDLNETQAAVHADAVVLGKWIRKPSAKVRDAQEDPLPEGPGPLQRATEADEPFATTERPLQRVRLIVAEMF